MESPEQNTAEEIQRLRTENRLLKEDNEQLLETLQEVQYELKRFIAMTGA